MKCMAYIYIPMILVAMFRLRVDDFKCLRHIVLQSQSATGTLFSLSRQRKEGKRKAILISSSSAVPSIVVSQTI